jgi:hypothetical protein
MSIRSAFCSALLLSVAQGCAYTGFAGPHQPYTPLLDHAGQVDVSVRGGAGVESDAELAAQVAYAPIESLEIAANVDYAGDFNQEGAEHVGGGLAIGSFSRTDVLRVESFLGVDAGYGTGVSYDSSWPGSTSRLPSLRLTGPYVTPFAQVAIGLEVPYFEFAGGVRVGALIADVLGSGNSGDLTQQGTLLRASIDTFITLRVPFDIFRVELMLGAAYQPPTTWTDRYVQGDELNPYARLGFGVQFDTL